MRLIEAVKIQAKCEQDSELVNLPAEKKERIANLLQERVPSGLAPLDEWNELLCCFGEKNPLEDCDTAKKKLLELLNEKN